MPGAPRINKIIPERQPAQHLCEFVDGLLTNRFFDTIEDLDRIVGGRCAALTKQRDRVRDSMPARWWPRLRART